MRAIRLTELGAPFNLEDIPAPDAKGTSLKVLLKCAALNRRDYWMQQGQYPGIALPVTPGSDGAGICNGHEVVINPGLFWGDKEEYQSSDFHILGMPEDGTLAEEAIIPAENIHEKPSHLTWEEAAALPLAGVTAFRALFTQGQAKPGEKLLITGIGGGVALTAMQFAIASGMEVCVTSGNDEKLSNATALGAIGTANYHRADWTKDLSKAHGLFDIILDSAGGDSFNHLLKLVRPGGRIIVYGGTQGKIQNLSPQVLYWRQITLRGTTMGSQKDFGDMLKFVSEHQIRPVVDAVFEMDQINDAVAKLRDGTQFGKVVVRITP